jgi:hypothetical protein
MGSFDVLLDDERTQLDAFVEEYRSALEATLNGLTEDQARRRFVPSATTLLGLLKHVTWMQRVWSRNASAARPVGSWAWCRARTSPSGSPTTTPSPPSRRPIETPARRPGRRSPTCRWTPW